MDGSTGFPYREILRAAALEEQGHSTPLKFLEAAKLVKSVTLNTQWYNNLMRRAQAANLPAEVDTAWQSQAAEEYPRRLHHYRNQMFTATQGHDLKAVAATSIDEGHLHAMAGDYHQAQLLYRQAASADSELEVEVLFHSSRLEIVQSNWPLVATMLGKHSSQFGSELSKWPSIAYFYSMASWMLGNFSNSAAALLQVSVPSLVALENDPELEINPHSVATMLSVSAMIAFSRENLLYARNSDPVFLHYGADYSVVFAAIDAFLATDILKFWAAWEQLAATSLANTQRAKTEVRRLLEVRHLQIHEQAPLAETLKLFSVSGFDATVQSLADTMAHARIPIEVDTVNDTIRLVASELDATPLLTQTKLSVRTGTAASWAAFA